MMKRGPVLEPIPSVDEEVPPTDDNFEEELDHEEPNKSEQDKENNIIISLPGMTSRKRFSEDIPGTHHSMDDPDAGSG